ncbi:MAG TPA: GAP family protein [Nakamurella sp.]
MAALPVVLIPIALAAKRPPALARAFLLGWTLGILLVGTVVIALADVLVLPSGNVAWLGYAKIALGLLLVVLAVRGWAGRPRAGAEPAVPGWMAGIESMSRGRAFGLAFLLATLNPKNLVLVVAGATTIAEATPVRCSRQPRSWCSRSSAASGSRRPPSSPSSWVIAPTRC